MSLYRLSLSTIRRRDGRSAVAAAAYRAGTRLRDDLRGRAHDYSRKRGVVHTELIGWTGDRAALWNVAETTERRVDARTAREAQLALPVELPQLARVQLARGFAGWLRDRYGVAVDVCVHEARRGAQDNPHAHLLMTTRAVTGDQFGAKVRTLDAPRTAGAEVEAMRAEWAAQVNAALAAHGVAARVDHRSLARRGELAAPIHAGRAALALEDRGEPTERASAARAARRRRQPASALSDGVQPVTEAMRRRARHWQGVEMREAAAAEQATRQRRALAAVAAAEEGPAVAPSGPQEPRTGARQPAPTPPDKAPPKAAERAERATLARSAR